MMGITNLNKPADTCAAKPLNARGCVLTVLLSGLSFALIYSSSYHAPFWDAGSSNIIRKDFEQVGYSSRFMRINDYLFNGKEGKTVIAATRYQTAVVG